MEKSRIIEHILVDAANLGYNFKNKLGKKSIHRQINGSDTLACERLGYTGPVADIFKENGYSSIFFNPGNKIDTDNVKCYETVSRLDDNSIKRFTISRDSLNMIDIITDESTFRTVAYSVVKHGIRYALESFEPSVCGAIQYSEATGLPIIYDVTSLKNIYNSINESANHSTSTSEPPFLVMFKKEFKQKKNGPRKKTQSVRLLYLDKASFLAGEEPAIIMFSHVAERYNSNGVFRRNKDGRYIDNGSYKESKDGADFDTYSFDEVMELAGDMVKPIDEDLMAGIRGNYEAVIPKEYMDLSVSLINRTMAEDPNGGEIADTEQELI